MCKHDDNDACVVSVDVLLVVYVRRKFFLSHVDDELEVLWKGFLKS